jgi:regulator-associated protein of mTOR
VRIFRHYDRPGKLEVVSAFKGLPNNEPSSLGEAGCVTDWQQSTGLLIVGGNSRDMKVWNSRRESCIEDIKTRSNSCLTSLSSDHHSGWIISAGFGDGSVRIFDRRKPSKNSMVKVFRSVHSSWCSQIKFQGGHRRELFSGDSTGLVAQWDARFDSPLRTFMAHDEGMPALDLHDHSPLLATLVFIDPIVFVSQCD